MTLIHLLSSPKWAEYFQGLEKTVNLDLYVFDQAGSRVYSSGENPFCRILRSNQSFSSKCSDFCERQQLDRLKEDEPLIYKCYAGLTNFVIMAERYGEKAYVVGKGGFASSDDLFRFIRIVKDTNVPMIPVSKPLSFTDEDHMKALAGYVQVTVTRMLQGSAEKSKVEEKLLRLTALFDSRTFAALSKSPELIYRYIMDSIKFIFGNMSTVLMIEDKEHSVFSAIYSTGRLKDELTGFSLGTSDPVVAELVETGTVVFHEEDENELSAVPGKEGKISYFFPLFRGGALEGIIGVFDRKLSTEDMKMMKAFRDYVQLNLDNQALRLSIDRNRKADERLNTVPGFSRSIIHVQDFETLLKALLKKSLQILNAEKGSLMLFDNETSEFVVEAHIGPNGAVTEKMRVRKDKSIAGQVIDSGTPLLVSDIEMDQRIMQKNRPRFKTKSFISTLIRIEDSSDRVLNVSDKVSGEVFNEEDLEMIQSFINTIAVAIEHNLLLNQAEELKRLSITDSLTGIYNRRYLDSRLTEEITRYNRYKRPFSILMLDLDKFKEYNDTFGHISGDRLLKFLASVIENTLRTIDIAARFGGDEFITILPETPKLDAIQIANRLKDNIDKSLSQQYGKMPLSLSMGLATFPDDANSVEELLEKTDQALYLAKKGGGNRVVPL
ncbi:MAG: diguanylate cyclase [Nitrospirae bacterium]|nr:diguanylate cyclase [Nitrospirota bacterium]